MIGATAATVGLILGAASSDSEPKPAPQAQASPKTSLPLDHALGQLLVMSFDGTDVPAYITRRLRAGQGTGVILFANNAPDPATLRAITRQLQRAADGGALIATDQEGGEIRSVKFAPPQASPATITSHRAAAENAKAGAQQLRANGINVNLAPVADVAATPASVMAGRAYPGTAKQVSGLVREAVEAHERESVGTTAKHFPGLGRATANTDDQPVTLAAPRRELENDLEPFKAAIDARVPLVMTSHATYSAIDREHIASQSRRVHRVLRDELGFGGVVVTDSIEADAVLARTGVAVAAERSIAAGADLVLMTGSASWNEVYPRLRRRARRDGAFRARVNESARRVLALKRRLGMKPAG